MSILDTLQRRIHGEAAWPPDQATRDHWAQVQDHRRRFEAEEAELLRYNTYINGNRHRASTFTPVPLARELGRYSASLLFSEPPKITFDTNPTLMDEVLENNGLEPFFQSAAERIAIEGAGCLRIIRDDRVNDGAPYLTYVEEDQVIWNILHGRAVTGGVCVFEYQPPTRTGLTREIWRLLEEHGPGYVERKVYRGQFNRLGVPVEWEQRPEPWQGLEEGTLTGLDVPTAVRWLNVPSGESDIQGLHLLLDRYDEGTSIFTDKARKSVPLVVVNRALADKRTGAVDLDSVVLTSEAEEGGIKATLGENSRIAEVAQPGLQSADHIAYLSHLREEIVTKAGYSAASWALDKGSEGAASGAALEKKLMRTLNQRAAKERMAKEAMINAVAVALAWHDGGGLGLRTVKDYRPEIQLGTGIPMDTGAKAQELQVRKGAGLVSLRQALREQHPAWTEEEIEDEIREIEDEKPEPPVVAVPREEELSEAETDSPIIPEDE